MPFKICDAKGDMQKFLDKNPECVTYAKALDAEYKLKKDILELRVSRNKTQGDVAKESGFNTTNGISNRNLRIST